MDASRLRSPLPWSRQRFDLEAYRVCATFRESPRVVDEAWANDVLMPLWWRQYLAFEGSPRRWRLTDHGADFCAAMEAHLEQLDRAAGGCAACGGIYHPATGHVLSASMRLCGPCARDMSSWVKRHVSKRWNKGDFYGAAATSIRAGEEQHPRSRT